jgi:hypothetical protein
VTLIVAVGRHFGEVAVPRLARIDPQFVVRFAEQQAPGAFDVRRGERLAVVPLDALAQCEGQLGPVFTPRPSGRQIWDHRCDGVLLYVLVEHDQVVEDPHRRASRHSIDFLVHRQAWRRVEGMHPEDAARFLCEAWRNAECSRHQRRGRERA